ncbi:MAG: hypothetical protein JSU81_07115 [Candidatus Coatesbacteria bacterium]|nr:MAG: hypothetical protein JSU81_07115 [Candidatus Coatesbacteria bacterium]
MPSVGSSEQVERIFYEHISFLYKTIIFGVVTTLLGIAAAIIVNMWWIGLIGLLGFSLLYFKRKKRNRFIITNERFIREEFNPHHNIIAVPLKNILDVKLLNRTTDKFGTVRVETTPEFGDQLLVDGDREVGVILCHKIPDHGTFAEIITFARDLAVGRA